LHIPDGILTAGLSITGYSLSLGITAAVLWKNKRRFLLHSMTKISLVAAVVFTSSLIHIPMGFTSVHFTFTPLAGILLGPSSFLAVFLALFLQWLLLGHGGIVTLGVNAFNMGAAALIAYFIFSALCSLGSDRKTFLVSAAVIAGVTATFTTVSLGSAFLIAGGFPAETYALLLFAHLPVFAGEGGIAGFAAYLLLTHFRQKELFRYDAQKGSSGAASPSYPTA